MAQRRKNRIGLTHPAVTFTAAGLLLVVTFNQMLHLAPRTRLASAALPAGVEPPPMSSLSSARLTGPSAPVLPSAGDAPRTASADLHAGPPVPQFPAPPPQALIGPAAPVHGPEWKQAPLPVMSPEVLQAMQNPRAVRRARHLLQMGFVPPPDPAPGQPPAPPRQGNAGPVRPKSVVAAASGSRPSHAPPAPEAAGAQMPVPAAAAKPDRPEPAGKGQGPATPAHPDGAAGPGKAASGTPVTTGETGTQEAKPGGESGGKAAAGSGTTPPAASQPPIRLQAHLDHPQSEYRVGEWVAVRFLASQPVHLRVYRVDAAGHVTRVFSTYGREDRGSPARTFSMMVKAGEPQPGQEGMVAIGSARPLTRDELLACLRAYLAEGPVTSAASAGPPAAPSAAPSGGASMAAPPPLTDVLKTVIDAVGQTADMPDTAAAPLERSAWSIAVGRFTSAERKLSAVSEPRAAKESPGGS